jgi:hypothetical protein
MSNKNCFAEVDANNQSQIDEFIYSMISIKNYEEYMQRVVIDAIFSMQGV